MQQSNSLVWVAESPDELLGVIGIVASSADVAEVAWLHVAPRWRAIGVAERLLEAALAHCREQGFLKIVLRSCCFWDDTLIDQFRRLGFEHVRTKHASGVERLHFYRDLYRRAAAELPTS